MRKQGAEFRENCLRMQPLRLRSGRQAKLFQYPARVRRLHGVDHTLACRIKNRVSFEPTIVCQASLCRTKRFGVGFGEEEMPVLGSLTKYSSHPPQWFLSVNKKRIELKSEQLYSPNLFALACLDQANLIVPIPKPKDWKQHFLKPMMQDLQEVEPLESLNPENEIIGLLQDWTTNRQSARTMDDIFNKLPYTDEKREFTYFRMEDFYNFCKRNHWEKDKNYTGNLLKRLTIKEGYSEDIFVEEERVRIKKQQPRLIKIKTMKQTDASISKVPYQEENF